MVKQPLWDLIRETLSGEISDGRYPIGTRLPSEADLAVRFGVNRHTVRRALAKMAENGMVHPRRGAGVFVTGAAIAYRLGPRTRFTQNLASLGHTGSREILRLETLPANAADAEEMDLAEGTPVHVLEAVGSADGVPILYGRSVHPADSLTDFPTAMRRSGSITAALRACGVEDYRRRTTNLRAVAATGSVARHLLVADGAAVLMAKAVNERLDGVVVEVSRTWFASERVELVLDGESFAQAAQ